MIRLCCGWFGYAQLTRREISQDAMSLEARKMLNQVLEHVQRRGLTGLLAVHEMASWNAKNG